MSFLKKMMNILGQSMLGNRMGGGLGRDMNYRGRSVRPASEDPYGDPADQMGSNVGHGGFSGLGPRQGGISQGGFGNVRPASEDPYGDPADQMGRQSWGQNRVRYRR